MHSKGRYAYISVVRISGGTSIGWIGGKYKVS